MMTKDDKEKLRVALQGMCSVMNVKFLDEAGFAFWFMTLQEQSYDDVRQALLEWSKTEKFLPKPSEILARIKAKHASERASVMGPDNFDASEGPSKEVVEAFQKSMSETKHRAIPVDAWAYRAMIKEAYGFSIPAFVKNSWRKALGKDPSYNFEDSRGVFPLDDAPDQRTSIYHDCQKLFGPDYEAKHGFKLKYDKELAYKKYNSSPLRYDGWGNAVRSEA